MSSNTIGFIGVGRLGFPMACSLLDAGYSVVCTSRGRAAELVARGAKIAGDGTARDVAEASDVVFSCLPSVAAFQDVTEGPEGILAAEAPPSLIELSTLPLAAKRAVREKFVGHNAELLDAPVSGTPPMAEAKMAVVYASGDRALHDRFADPLKAMSPAASFVGPFGAGTKFKFVAQFLSTINVTAAVEAMVYAERAGLDLHQVAELISASPGAMSGQFKIRAPMIAAGQFEGKLVTVDMLLKDVDEVMAYGEEIAAPTDLLAIVSKHYHELADAGDGDAEPAKLFAAMLNR